jgi:hypothetical protein
MRAMLLMFMALAGCVAPDSLPWPSAGYRALRFVEPMRVPGLFADFDIEAGTTFVADRTVGGVPMYCGTALERSFLMAQSVAVCAFHASETLTFVYDRVIAFGDPPPMKWSVLRYGFEPEEDRDGEEGAQARGDRGQAAAGGRLGVAGPERG